MENRHDKHDHRPVPPTPPYPPYHRKHPFKPHNRNANFAPPLMQYHIPHAFKFWCNRALPFVYDDSLSFYELLNKVVHYMNNIFEDEKLMTANIGELAEAYKALEKYVNDYFAFYQSKGLIVYDVPITNENYLTVLPDLDTAQMNTIYRFNFVEGSEQRIPENVPDGAKPFSGQECLFINISNFILKYIGGMYQTPPECESDGVKPSECMVGNYQLLITDKNFYTREHNGDTWGEWVSIFDNWYSEIWEQIKEYVDTQDNAVKAELLETINNAVEDLTGLITEETNRATAAEQALGNRIDGINETITNEINRATAAEQALSNRIDTEVDRATAAEGELNTKIEQEIDDRENADTALSNAITAETTRATNAENELSSRITAEVSRATTAENDLSSRITAEIGRATAAENALSARIQTWETDLAAETLDRQQGDRALGLRIDGVESNLTAETSRATAAEQALDSKIDSVADDLTDETDRATAAEQALGTRIDDLSDDLTEETVRATAAEQGLDERLNNEQYRATRAEAALSTRVDSVEGDITNINTDIDNVESSVSDVAADLVAEVTRATAKENEILQTIADGYIPNAGNNKASNLVLTRNGYSFNATAAGYAFLLGDNNGIFNVQKMLGSGVTPALFRLSKTEIIVDPLDDTWIKKTERTIDGVVHSAKAYYGNSITADNEIATKGDVSAATAGMATLTDLDEYVPNEGNDLSSVIGSEFILKRLGIINIESKGVEISLSSMGGIILNCSNGQIQVDGDGWIISNANDCSYLKVNDKTVFEADDDDNKKIIVGDQSNNPNIITYIIGGGSAPDDFEEGINVYTKHVTIYDNFTAMAETSDPNYSSNAENTFNVTSLGITGQTTHGSFVPTLVKTLTVNSHPNMEESVISFEGEELVFDMESGTYNYGTDSLKLEQCAKATFNGDNTVITVDVDTDVITDNSTESEFVFNDIIFNANDPTQYQTAFVNAANTDSTFIFNRCVFNGSNRIMRNFTGGKMIFNECVFTFAYPTEFTATGNAENTIVIKNCVFSSNVSAMTLTGGTNTTFIVTGNKVGAINKTGVSNLSSCYEWNNGATGGSGYSETVLFTNNSAGDITANLSDDYTNYDELVFVVSYTDGILRHSETRVLTSNIPNVGSLSDCFKTTAVWVIDFPSTTSVFMGQAGGVTLQKIIGIKY